MQVHNIIKTSKICCLTNVSLHVKGEPLRHYLYMLRKEIVIVRGVDDITKVFLLEQDLLKGYNT